MKKLFLFALFAALCCSCTESGTDENTDPNGGSNSGQTTPPDPDPDAKDVIHVPEGGMLGGILNELGLTEPSSLKLSGTLTYYDFKTLRKIQSLEHLDISRVNLSVLPTEAFSECTNIKSLILPNTLTAIRTQAFWNTSLVSISIPASVETIDASAFKGCSSLATVTFEKGSKLKTIEGSHHFYDDDNNYYCGTFSDCRALTSIEIPASVETIEDSAFKGCSKLATVTFEKGSRLKRIEGTYYSNGDNLHSYGAFSDCSALTSIEIPASVETIEWGAFYRCTALQSVTFEKGSQLKTINGFLDCTSLTTIEIPASVETIKYSAFKGCTSLKTVTFEKGTQLKTFDGFAGCTSLTTIEIPASVETIEDDAFSRCTSLTTIEIPASVETIKDDAFYRCTSLQTVTFEKGSQLKTFGGFRSCTSLTTIEIPASVETIKGAAFQYCTSLQTVTFEKGTKLKTIGNLTFCGCTSLTTIEIPASVETIEEYAFWNCTALTTVDMSACTQVTEIGDDAFSEDPKLQLFKIGTRTPPRCGNDVFTGINSYSVLKVPVGCVNAYKKATGWKEFTTISELDE